MAGTLIRVVPKTDVVGTGVGTTAIESVLDKAMSIIQFTSVIVIWRMFAKSASGTAQTANLFIRNAAPTPDDPTLPFVGSTIGTATFSINGGTTGPQTPQIITLAAPLGSHVQVVLSLSQATGGTALTFSHSIDIVGRE